MVSQRYALLIGLLVLPILSSLGCSGEHMVTLKISGTSTSEQRDKISEKAKSLTDGSSNYFSSYHMNDTYTVNVGPVMDVEAFVEQIDFGKVTKVEERTIFIDLNAQPEAEEPAANDPASTEPEPMEEAATDSTGEEK